MKTFGLIGYPLQHSFSKKFFMEKFQKEAIDAEYVNFEIPSIQEFNNIRSTTPHLCGLNVTLPYKEKIIPYLDRLAESAQKVGAVNVIQIIKEQNKITTIGHNSDLYGFYESIKPLIQPKTHTRALVLGTGGASKAVIQGLIQLNIEPQLVSRKRKKGTLTYEDLTSNIIEQYKVIVNCTPLGTYPNVDSCPDLPYNQITPNHLLYDLAYNPETTLFLKKGIAQGAQTINGLRMLHLQAERSWEIWNS